MHVAGSDGVAGLHHFPFFVLIAHGALDQRIATPFESAKSRRRAQRLEVASTGGRGRAGGNQIGARTYRAVAIDAIDLDRSARLAINFSVAVIVLPEVAIGA